MEEPKPASLYFSFKDRETVDKMKLDLQEEVDLLESMSTKASPMAIRFLRWLGSPIKDYKPCTIDKKDTLKRHVTRHECHLDGPNHIFELSYSVEGRIKSKVYTTFALSEEQATGMLEDEIIRVLDMDVAPVVKKIRNYGPQPIAWCIDWTHRMIDDVSAKDKAING